MSSRLDNHSTLYILVGIHIINRILMSVKILQAKNDFLDKLNNALDEEKSFATILRPTLKQTTVETREQILERLARDLKNPQPATKHNEPIHLKFGDYMDKFVTRVQDAHTHQENVGKLSKLIETTRLELAHRTTTVSENPPKKKSIHIKFKDGAIRPTHKVSRNLDLYHWELNSDAQPWTSIGIDSEIRPMISAGEVRLHYKGDEYVSNKINIATVIKRQASAAKRKQYRFELEDVEFQQRCAGVAGRIQRLLSPPVRNITNASFDMRVFQDRVAKLPTHLNVDLSEIVDLCEENDITDPDYIAMVEFIEPTVHLNPRKLHSELKDIYEGKRILLKIDEREVRAAPSPAPSSAPRNLFMLDSGSTKEDEGETKRQISRARAELEKQQRLQEEKYAQEQAKKLRLEQEEIARKAQEDNDRLERERQQQVADAEAAAEKLRLEQEEIALKAQEEDDRIELERLQQVADAEAAAEKLRLEQDELARKAQEDNERLQKEHELIARQKENVDILTSSVSIMSEYTKATGKGSGQENSNGNEWFIVNGKNDTQSVYKTTKTNKSPPRKSTMEKANAAGWYSKEFTNERERKLQEEKEKLQQETEEIARKAQEEDDRIELERLQQVADAEAAAEKLRLEREEIARKVQEDNERIERERQQQVDDAEAAAENLRLEQEELARKAQEDNERLERERQQQVADAETKKREAVEQLSESDKNYIKYVFDWYDKEPKDGRIELSELKDALSSAGYEAASAEEMLNEYDKDGNGNLDYDEFETWCAVTNAVHSWKNSNAEFIQTEWRVEDLVNIKNYSRIRLNGIPGTLKKFKKKFYFQGKGKDDKYTFIKAPRQQQFEVEVDVSSSEEQTSDEEPKEDELSTMTISDLKNRAAALNKKKKGTVKGYSKFRNGDEEKLSDLIRTAESNMSIVPPGELSEMLNNMTDDWASSDEELNFAADSENEDMEFAASSAVDTDDSDLDFAESSDKKTSSGLEFAESSHTSSGIEFAASSAVDSDKSEDFAASSAIDTDSDLDFAESSGKTSSGLDFAESSTVESD